MSRPTIIAITIWLVIACGGGTETGTSSTQTPATSPTSTTTPITSSTSTAGTQPRDASEAIVQAAIADLAGQLDVGETQISLVSFEEVTWRDGSLGCPEAGMAYTQALVDGSRTVLEVDGTTYAYHSGGGREPFLCDDPVVEDGRLTTTVPGYDY